MEEAERLCDELLIMDHGRIMARGAPRALIKEHVEPEVIEVHHCPPALEQRIAGTDGNRIEHVGETLYCYTRDSGSIVPLLEGTTGLSYLIRPANLEDVFLRLTGRELRE
jgi:lipooligosaccharide transport system ATP-binding protein